MRAKQKKQFFLNTNNHHLLDIFAEARFIDLGVSAFKEIQALLNEAIIDFSKLVFKGFIELDIPNRKGISEDDQQKLMMNFFFQMHQKDLSNQLFLTYGLIKYKDAKNKEKFAPLLLLPISLSYEQHRFLVKITGNVMENTMLIDLIKLKSDVILPTLTKSKLLRDLDQYCFAFQESTHLELRMGNLITYANSLHDEIYIPKDKFYLHKQISDNMDINTIVQDHVEFKPVFPMNASQKSAMLQYLEGNSFKIEGIFGSGKTTSLMNIALIEMARHKRVLYISNIFHSRKQVYDQFQSWGLANFAFDIHEPFLSHNEQKSLSSESSKKLDEIFSELLRDYEIVAEYETDIFARVRNNRVISVLNDLIYLKDRDLSILPIQRNNDLFLYEYEVIFASLRRLEDLLGNIHSFTDSVWKHIPIDHQITYPNQAITLVYKLHKSFVSLRDKEEDLREMGLKPHNYYIRFRRFSTNTKHVFETKLPTEWLEENFSTLEEAFASVGILRTNLGYYQHLKSQLTLKYYDSFFDFDFKQMMHNWHPDDLYTDKEQTDYYIDQLIANRKYITSMINRFTSLTETMRNSLSKISKIMNWNFAFDDDTLRDLFALSNYLLEHKISEQWFLDSYKKGFSKVKDELEYLHQFYLNYQELDSWFISEFGQNHKDIQNIIELVKNVLYKKQIKGLYNKRLYKKTLEEKDIAKYETYFSKLKEYSSCISAYETNKTRYERLAGQSFSSHSSVLDSIDRLAKVLKHMHSSIAKKNIIEFLTEYAKSVESFSDITKSNYAPFVLFQKAYFYLDRFTHDMSKYGFDLENLNFVEKLEKVTRINQYIKNMYSDHDSIKSLFRHEEKYILMRSIHDLIEEQIKYQLVLKEFYDNPNYLRLYSAYFNYENTDLGKLIQVMSSLKTFVESFESPKAAFNAISKYKEEISRILQDAEESFVAASQAFTVYPKLFDDKVGGYYYDDLGENIAHLNALLHSKDELIVYLKVIEELRVLKEYRLNDLIGYILQNEKETNLADSFAYTYFLAIWERQKAKMKYSFKDVQKVMPRIVENENQVFQHNLKELIHKIKQQDPCFFTLHATGRNYSRKIQRYVSKFPLVISSTLTANQLLNVQDFDLVLIDDAHVGPSNLYNQAILSKQLIISGDKQYNRFVRKSLIARITDRALIRFTTRYISMPKDCLTITNDSNGLTLPLYAKNKGLKVVKKAVHQVIIEELLKNRNIRMNVFVYEITTIRKMYLKVVSLLIAEGFHVTEIMTIMQDQINITQLRTRYLLNADLHILDVEDFNIEFSEINTDRMIMDALSASSQVVLCDSTSVLRSSPLNKFIRSLQESMKSMSLDFHSHTLNYPMETKLKEAFEKRGFVALGNHGNLDFVFSKKNQMYGVLLFWDKRTLHFETISDYRLFNEHYVKHGWIIFTIWVEDLFLDFENTIESIVKNEETKNGK